MPKPALQHPETHIVMFRWGDGPMKRPLEKLRRGETNDALNAAPAYLFCIG